MDISILPPEVINAGLTIIGFLVGYLIGRYNKQYQVFKKKYEDVMAVLKAIEIALQDDKVTKEELKDIYEKLKKVLT